MTDDRSSTPASTDHHDTDTRWGHKKLGGPWWLALLLVPLLLAALLAGLKGGDLEGDLKERTEAALDAKGVSGADVDFDGRDGSISLPDGVPSGMDNGDVEAIAADVDGVRTASVAKGAGGSADAGADDGSGDSGATPSEDAESASPDASGDASAAAGGGANCADVQAGVDKVLGKNAVAFGEAAARLKGREAKQVAKVGRILADCGATVAVTGHTDDRARPNSPLSQKRADAVAKALRAAGVDVASAKGVGGADPIGDNTTKAGRDLNRFAAISVQ